MRLPTAVYVMITGLLLQAVIVILCVTKTMPPVAGPVLEVALLAIGLVVLNRSRPQYFSVEVRYIVGTLVLFCGTVVILIHDWPLT